MIDRGNATSEDLRTFGQFNAEPLIGTGRNPSAGIRAASIRRCWSNWNTLCDFLYAGELITANPMPLIGRPKVAKTLPRGLGAETVSELLMVIDVGSGSGADQQH